MSIIFMYNFIAKIYCLILFVNYSFIHLERGRGRRGGGGGRGQRRERGGIFITKTKQCHVINNY